MFIFFGRRCAPDLTVATIIGVSVNDIAIGVIFSLGKMARMLTYTIASLVWIAFPHSEAFLTILSSKNFRIPKRASYTVNVMIRVMFRE